MILSLIKDMQRACRHLHVLKQLFKRLNKASNDILNQISDPKFNIRRLYILDVETSKFYVVFKTLEWKFFKSVGDMKALLHTSTFFYRIFNYEFEGNSKFYSVLC